LNQSLGLGLGLGPHSLGLGLETLSLGLVLGLETQSLGLCLGLVDPSLDYITDFDPGDGNVRKFQKFPNSRRQTDAILKIIFWL